MRAALEIASEISETVEKSLRDEMTVEEGSARTWKLWAEAKELGLHDQVSDLLQKWSSTEMKEAIERLQVGRE